MPSEGNRVVEALTCVLNLLRPLFAFPLPSVARTTIGHCPDEPALDTLL
jgi:hypothetical protein